MNAELPRALCEAVAPLRSGGWPGQHVIHTGSAAEYGNAGAALREDGPAEPSTRYGQTKLAGTRAVAKACAALGIRGLAVRLFTVYGPGEHAGRLLPSLIEASRTGRAVDLSAGLQRRDFTYVEDVAESLLRLGLTSSGSGIVNVATGRLTTVRGFAETAAEILGIPRCNLNFGRLPAGPHEMEHEPVSLARLRGLAGCVPQTGIHAGIRRTLERSRPAEHPVKAAES
jgi:nucleoside-diphosphate-sugar epimerase